MSRLKKLYRRHLRTAFLAVFAAASFAWAAVRVFDVDPDLMWSFLQSSVMGLLILIAIAIVPAAILVGLKRLRKEDEPH